MFICIVCVCVYNSSVKKSDVYISMIHKFSPPIVKVYGDVFCVEYQELKGKFDQLKTKNEGLLTEIDSYKEDLKSKDECETYDVNFYI